MSNWNAFLRTLEAVLSAFASIPIPEEASVRADDFCAIKYLTSSRLIRLQVRNSLPNTLFANFPPCNMYRLRSYFSSRCRQISQFVIFLPWD